MQRGAHLPTHEGPAACGACQAGGPTSGPTQSAGLLFPQPPGKERRNSTVTEVRLTCHLINSHCDDEPWALLGRGVGGWWCSQALRTHSRIRARRRDDLQVGPTGPRVAQGRQAGQEGLRSQALAKSLTPCTGFFDASILKAWSSALPQFCGAGPMSLNVPKLAKRHRAAARGGGLGPGLLWLALASGHLSCLSFLTAETRKIMVLHHKVCTSSMERSFLGSTCAWHTAGSRERKAAVIICLKEGRARPSG